jgi:hypothetical protein
MVAIKFFGVSALRLYEVDYSLLPPLLQSGSLTV